MWVRLDKLPEGDNEALFAGYGTVGGVRKYVALGYKRPLHIFFTNWGEAVYSDKYTSEIFTGSWYFVIATYSADRNKLYLDGQLVNSMSQMQFETPPQSEFRLGFIDYSDIQRQLVGELSEVRIYSRALTEPEIRFLNQSGSKDRLDENGQRLVVRNGHLPEREVISGAGPVSPHKLGDCSAEG